VLMELTAPLRLDPLTLAFALEGDGLVAGRHRLTVDLVGPPGSDSVLDVDDAVAQTGTNGHPYLTARIVLQGGMIPTVGDYEFRVRVDGQPVGAIPFKAGLARDGLRADFNAFYQESQGIENGQKYLRGRLHFDLWNQQKGFAGRTNVVIAQPEGGDFTKDPLTLVLPRGYERLGRSPGFKEAVRKAHDHYVLGMFGGKFPEAGSITLENNSFAGGGISVEFDLGADAEGGGW